MLKYAEKKKVERKKERKKDRKKEPLICQD